MVVYVYPERLGLATTQKISMIMNDFHRSLGEPKGFRMSNDLIHDVEDSIKEERLYTFWRENGPYLIAGVILALVLTGGMSAWHSYMQSRHADQTAQLLTALEVEDNSAARLVEAAAPMDAGLQAIALMNAAARLIDQNQMSEAQSVLQDVAGSDAPAVYKNLARLQLVQIQWDEAMAMEDMTPEGLQEKAAALNAKLAPLTQDGTLFQAQALLLSAHIEAQGLQQTENARNKLIRLLEMADLPPSVSTKARALGHLIDHNAL